MALSKARAKANKKWDTEHLHRSSLALPVDEWKMLEIHAQQMGEPINKFVRRAIRETIKHDEQAAAYNERRRQARAAAKVAKTNT